MWDFWCKAGCSAKTLRERKGFAGHKDVPDAPRNVLQEQVPGKGMWAKNPAAPQDTSETWEIFLKSKRLQDFESL